MQPDIQPDHLKIVLEILNRVVPDREVWVFGSRATGTARDTSDLDLWELSCVPEPGSGTGPVAEPFFWREDGPDPEDFGCAIAQWRRQKHNGGTKTRARRDESRIERVGRQQGNDPRNPGPSVSQYRTGRLPARLALCLSSHSSKESGSGALDTHSAKIGGDPVW